VLVEVPVMLSLVNAWRPAQAELSRE